LSGIARIHAARQVDRLDLDVSEGRSKQIVLDPRRIGVAEGPRSM